MRKWENPEKKNPVVQLLLARTWPTGDRGRQHWCHRLSQHWLSFVWLPSCCHGGIVQPDCLDWILVCLRGWIIQYIFSETIQSMWTEISTLLLVGLYCIGLCISIRFLLLFLFLLVCCFHRGWHIYLYRPSVLLFNTIPGLIDFSTALSAQRGCGCAIWRELKSCHCDRSQLGEKALNVQHRCWIGLWWFGWFCSLRIPQCFSFNGWWAHSILNLLIGSLIDSLCHQYHFMYFLFLRYFHYCRAILSLTRVCTFFFLIWHVVLMQNDKTGACECVCWIYFLKCKWFCVCMCVCEC